MPEEKEGRTHLLLCYRKRRKAFFTPFNFRCPAAVLEDAYVPPSPSLQTGARITLAQRLAVKKEADVAETAGGKRGLQKKKTKPQKAETEYLEYGHSNCGNPVI